MGGQDKSNYERNGVVTSLRNKESADVSMKETGWEDWRDTKKVILQLEVAGSNLFPQRATRIHKSLQWVVTGVGGESQIISNGETSIG